MEAVAWCLLHPRIISNVIPAKLAIASASRNPGKWGELDSRFRGNDDRGRTDGVIKSVKRDIGVICKFTVFI